jgi:hypothetical protein
LSPDLPALRRAATAWRRDLERAGASVPGEAAAERDDAPPAAERDAPPTVERDDAPPAAEPAARGFGGDRRVANGASLAFLVEYEGTSCLITGDAYPTRLERSLRLLLKQRGWSASGWTS